MVLITPIMVKKPTGHLLWVYGFICVLLSGLSAFFLTQKAPEIFKMLYDAGKFSSQEYEKSKSEIQIWLYIAPGVLAAIGANLITAFLTETK